MRASWILLALALVFAALALRDWRRQPRSLSMRARTWLLVAAIFVVISLATGL